MSAVGVRTRRVCALHHNELQYIPEENIINDLTSLALGIAYSQGEVFSEGVTLKPCMYR